MIQRLGLITNLISIFFTNGIWIPSGMVSFALIGGFIKLYVIHILNTNQTFCLQHGDVIVLCQIQSQMFL